MRFQLIQILVLKLVRPLTGLGLKEAKTLVKSPPKTVQDSLGEEAAEDAHTQIQDAGKNVPSI